MLTQRSTEDNEESGHDKGRLATNAVTDEANEDLTNDSTWDRYESQDGSNLERTNR
jgi:hypothetical protein